MKKHKNPVPTCGIVLENEKGEILLVKRGKPPKKDFWDIPGGFVDINESVEEAIKREIKEELGFDLKEFKYFASFPDKYFYQGGYENIIGLDFVGKISQEQKLEAASDISSYKFFPKDKLPLNRIAFKSVRLLLLDYLRVGSPKR